MTNPSRDEMTEQKYEASSSDQASQLSADVQSTAISTPPLPADRQTARDIPDGLYQISQHLARYDSCLDQLVEGEAQHQANSIFKEMTARSKLALALVVQPSPSTEQVNEIEEFQGWVKPRLLKSTTDAINKFTPKQQEDLNSMIATTALKITLKLFFERRISHRLCVQNGAEPGLADAPVKYLLVQREAEAEAAAKFKDATSVPNNSGTSHRKGRFSLKSLLKKVVFWRKSTKKAHSSNNLAAQSLPITPQRESEESDFFIPQTQPPSAESQPKTSTNTSPTSEVEQTQPDSARSSSAKSFVTNPYPKDSFLYYNDNIERWLGSQHKSESPSQELVPTAPTAQSQANSSIMPPADNTNHLHKGTSTPFLQFGQMEPIPIPHSSPHIARSSAAKEQAEADLRTPARNHLREGFLQFGQMDPIPFPKKEKTGSPLSLGPLHSSGPPLSSAAAAEQAEVDLSTEAGVQREGNPGAEAEGEGSAVVSNVTQGEEGESSSSMEEAKDVGEGALGK